MVIARLFWPPCQIQKFKFLMIFRHQADLNCLFYISLVNRPINTVWKTFVNDQKCSVLKLKLLIIARQNLNKSSFFKFLLPGKIIHLYPSAGKIRRLYPDGLPGFLFMAFVLTSGFCNKSSAGQIMTKEYIKLLLFQIISEFFTEISIELLNVTLS